MTRPRGVALGTVALLALVLSAGCDWTAPRYGPGRTGSNDTEHVLTAANAASLTTKWSAGTGLIVGAPVIGRGTLYATTTSGGATRVEARRASDALLRWSRDVSAGASAPTIVGNRVLVGVADGVVALDAATGNIIWHHETWGFPGVPTVAAGTAYVTWPDGSGPPIDGVIPLVSKVLAIDVDTGEAIWSRTIQGAASETTVGDGRVFVGTFEPDLLNAFEAADGTPIYSEPLTGYSLIFARGLVFGTYSSAVAVSATDAATGVLRYLTDGLGRGAIDSAAVDDDAIYACQFLISPRIEALVTAYATADGEVRWQQSGGCDSIVQANGVLYLAAIEGVRLRDASSGADLGLIPVDGRADDLIVANGSVYVAVTDTGLSTGHLVRLSLP